MNAPSSAAGPLQNRVTPFGEIVAHPGRGALMGNRGGRLHDPATRSLGRRRWASRRWIYCALAFRGRRRRVMGTGYTELFFLDRWTALAAGHRPCFECLLEEARAFQAAWTIVAQADAPVRADEIDRALHTERTGPRMTASADSLPDGAFVAIDGAAAVVWGDAAARWDSAGYARPERRPRGRVLVLTPASVVSALPYMAASSPPSAFVP